MKGSDMDVKRWSRWNDGTMRLTEDGQWVSYDDFARVEGERDALAAGCRWGVRHIASAFIVARFEHWDIAESYRTRGYKIGAWQEHELELVDLAAALASKGLPTHTARAVLGATDAPTDHPMSKLIAEANAAIDAEGGA